MKFTINRLCHTVFIFVFAISPLYVIGQERSIQFGKLKKTDWTDEKCPIDTNAGAYYLFDKGQATFLPGDKGWILTYDRHYRIKVNNTKGLNQRKQILYLKNKGSEGKEELVELKSITNNLNNKKIESITINPVTAIKSTPLSIIHSREDHTSFVSVDSSDSDWTTIELTIPNVKPGSIIEVYYRINSNLFFDFPSWSFQRDIPVLYSEYYTQIPEYFQYIPLVNGVTKVDQLKVVRGRDLYSFADSLVLYSATHIPAFTQFPYVRNMENYLSEIQFEFVGFKYGAKKESYLTTWGDLKKDLIRDTAFGAQLHHCHSYDSLATEWIKKNLSESEKLTTAFQYIRNTIKWNGEQGLKAEIPLDSVFKYRSGTAAEINLSLLCLLQKAGIDAKPLISSTVSHGLIQRSVPAEKWFNYTTALVTVEGKQQIIDAADPWGSPSLFSPDLINGHGLVIDSVENSWIEMIPNGLFQNQVNYQLFLNPQKGLTGTYLSRDHQYAAYAKRKLVSDSINEKNYFDDLNYRYPYISIFDIKTENKNESPKELIIEGSLHLFKQFKEKDGLLYWIPMQYERIMENPFKSSARDIPVEFPYPSIQNVIMEIKIPEDYEVESLPKSVRLASEDNTARYVFLTEQTDRTIRLNSLLSIKKMSYTPDEYPNLKEFLNRVVQKQAEAIVLKKK